MAFDDVAVAAAVDPISEVKKDERQGKHRDAGGENECLKDPEARAVVGEARGQ